MGKILLANYTFKGKIDGKSIKDYQNKIKQEPLPEPQFEKNLKLLAKSLKLNKVDTQILELLIMVNQVDILYYSFNNIDTGVSIHKTIKVIAELIGAPINEVKMSLRESSPLIKTGLLTFEKGPNVDLQSRFVLLTEDFAYQTNQVSIENQSI